MAEAQAALVVGFIESAFNRMAYSREAFEIWRESTQQHQH